MQSYRDMRIKIALCFAAISLSGASFASEVNGTYTGDGRGGLWLGTGFTVELPSRAPVSAEVGLGWFGVGGGINVYQSPSKQGLMLSGRVGSWILGYAADAEVNYVGSFSDRFKWRVGVGVLYYSTTFWVSDTGAFPIGDVELGFKF
jgi:hypothetical protein